MTKLSHFIQNKCNNCKNEYYIEYWRCYPSETYNTRSSVCFCSEKCHWEYEREYERKECERE